MVIVRTILALAISLAVALLPAAKAASPVAVPAAMAVGDMAMPDDMAMAADTMSADMADCCPKADPCSQPTDECASMAGCLLKCFAFAGAPLAPLAIAIAAGSVIPRLVAQPLRPRAGSPPFRPPRI